MRRPIVTTVVCVVLGAGALARGADVATTVPAALRAGLAAYEKGQPAEAIQSLQRAIDLIQQEQQAGVEKFLPEKLAGWQAGDLQREQYAGGGGEAQMAFFKVSRTFTREADEVTLTVALLNSPQYIVPQREMLNALKANPLVLQAMNQDENAKMSFIEREGWAGWQKVNKGAPESEAILIGEGWLLEIRVGIADGDLLGKVLQATDLKGIAGAGK